MTENRFFLILSSSNKNGLCATRYSSFIGIFFLILRASLLTCVAMFSFASCLLKHLTNI